MNIRLETPQDYCEVENLTREALVVIDIQNDITKHYRDVIGNINAAIDWASF